MAIESAADRLAFLDTNDFAVTASWTVGVATATVPCIHERPAALGSAMANIGFPQANPTLVCRAADLPSGYAQGNAVTVDGYAYKVLDVLPDGTGMARVDLERSA